MSTPAKRAGRRFHRPATTTAAAMVSRLSLTEEESKFVLMQRVSQFLECAATRTVCLRLLLFTAH